MGICVIVVIENRAGDHVEVEVNKVDDCMKERKKGEDHCAPLVIAHVQVQWDKLVDTEPP